MTTFLLLRHAHSRANDSGILAGQLPGVHLSAIGKRQKTQLHRSLRDQKIDRIISSPMDRCLETISEVAIARRKRISIDSSFIEMNYGAWSGRSLKELSREKSWKRIQRTPSSFTFPEGESFTSAARRIERGLTKLSQKYPRETILIVTHGDVIKIALQISSGAELDNFQNFVIDTCSLSELRWDQKSRLVIRSNVRIVKLRDASPRKRKNSQDKVLGGGSGV
jgi:broad specificity phosphatase PhoE